MLRCKVSTTSAAFLFAALVLPALAQAQLRVVQYNTGAGARPGLGTILEQIGNEQVNGFAKPIDVLLLQEVESSSNVNQVVNLLNGIYGPGTYAAAPFVGQTLGGGLPAMVYRNQSVDLVGTIAIGTINTSANARQTIRYQLRPDGYSSTADFFVYNSHFKAGNSMDGTDQARRNVEATTNRANADALGSNRPIIFAGDFNLYTGQEAAYQTLLAPGNAQAADPINTPLNWRQTSALRYAHTQSPATVQAYDGQVLGGMDDRFDFQLLTSAMRDNEGMSYIGGSYRAFGNNGTHPLNGPINSAQNSWNPPGLTVAASTIKTNLAQVSDHIPVVADYQIPAKMSVAVSAVPAQVIVDAPLQVNLTVSNTAPVVAAIGADELDYTFSGSGSLGDSGMGVALALTPGNTHSLAMNTLSPGLRSGTISVTSTSQGAANPNFSHAVSTTVLAHANPSFDPADATSSLVVNFGIRARGNGGGGSITSDFAIFNLPHSSGFTAGLDLDSIVAGGNTDALHADVATFNTLAAGGSHTFSASLNTANVGSFTTAYQLHFSDQDLPGATDLGTMLLALTGRIALGGDANLDDVVNLSDFNILASNFGSSAADWMTGDFTHDGLVNLADFNLLAANFGLSAGANGPTPDDWSALASAVPEPTFLMLLPVAGYSLLARRRRHASSASPSA